MDKKSLHASTFTGEDLYRLVCEWAYSTKLRDPGMLKNSGCGKIHDIRDDKLSIPEARDGVNSDTIVKIILNYGPHENLWKPTLESAANELADAKELSGFIDLTRANGLSLKLYGNKHRSGSGPRTIATFDPPPLMPAEKNPIKSW